MIPELDQAKLADICRRHEVRELAVFGSAARGALRPESDIDVLVEFLPDAHPGLLGFVGLQQELETLTGRRIDLVSKRGPKPFIRDSVLGKARRIYAA